ncbi:MAG TPA: hypothetical protein VHM23_01435 [Actinomycetota bacterium]|nr:hypothetical protein [Actinomycetota bacterium]
MPAELTAARQEDSFRTRAARRIGDTTVAVAGGEVAGFTMVVGDEVEQVYVAAGLGQPPEQQLDQPRPLHLAPLVAEAGADATPGW